MRSSRKLGEPPTLSMLPVNNSTPKTTSKTDTPTRNSSRNRANQKTDAKGDTPKSNAKGDASSKSDKKGDGASKNKPQQHEYKAGDKVLCLHKGSTVYYEAKIVNECESEGEKAFLVHYQGWNNRYDEAVKFSEIPQRFKVHSAEALAEAKQAQKEAAGGSSAKKPKGRSSAVDAASKLSNTPSGTAASSRSSTPFESGKRRTGRDSSLVEGSGGKRSRQSGKQSDVNSPLVPPAQAGLIGQSVASALAQQQQQANQPAKKPIDLFLEAFPGSFCEVLRADVAKIKADKLPIGPARSTIEEIVSDYKQSLGNPPSHPSEMRVEYGPNDSLEQTSPAFLALCADGLVDCFNSFVRSDLLYKDEWEGHDKKFKPLSEKKNSSSSNLPHKHYGIVHLIRLFSKATTLLERLSLQKEVKYASQANIQDFMAFVNKKLKKYYSEEDYK